MALVTLTAGPDGCRTVTFNDPDRRNAMGLEMADAFREIVTDLEADVAKRVVILTGTGAAFSAGGDLPMLQAKAQLSQEQNRADMLAFTMLSCRSRDCPCRSSRPSMATRLERALACDGLRPPFGRGRSEAGIHLHPFGTPSRNGGNLDLATRGRLCHRD